MVADAQSLGLDPLAQHQTRGRPGIPPGDRKLDPTRTWGPTCEPGRSLAGPWRFRAIDRLLLACYRAKPALTDYRRLIAFNLRDLGRLDEAIHQLETVLAVAPQDAEARTELVHIRQMRGDSPGLLSETPNADSLRTQRN